MRSFCAILTVATIALPTAAAGPKETADELRRRLIGRGPFKATYEIASPSTGKKSVLEITADLPWACVLISGVGSDREVRAYADARNRRLYVMGREGNQPVLFRTDAVVLTKTVHDIRSALIAAGLGNDAVLPAVTKPGAAEGRDGLYLFATLTLGPADSRRGPFMQSGTGLSVGTEAKCGSWLLDVAAAESEQLTATDEAISLAVGSRDGAAAAGRRGFRELIISRKTGLPITARAAPTPNTAVTLTLTHQEALKTFEPPTWVTTPPAGVKVKDLDLPERQRRMAAYTAWIFYVGRCITHLAGQSDWSKDLDQKRDQAVAALAPPIAPLWQDRGRGVPRGYVSVLRGAHLEALRRFRYVREKEPAKLAAAARQYADEALQRRADVLRLALDATMERFALDVSRSSTVTTRPADSDAVRAKVLSIIRRAAENAYLSQAADTIAKQLIDSREPD